MKLMDFAINPHIRNAARLYHSLFIRDEYAAEFGIYELIPYEALDDDTKAAADMLEAEGLIFIDRYTHVHDTDIQSAPCFDRSMDRKANYLDTLGDRLLEQDAANNFINCHDAVLPF